MVENRPAISAVVITLNEEDNIAACLEGLAWADEIVVLDSESTDRTVEIARKYTGKVFVEPWEGNGRHKNRAVELAAGPWIFSIDADERVSDELAAEIQDAVVSGRAGAYSVKRKNLYRGRWIKHGGWWPDRVKRLFQKDIARFNDALIHDSLVVNGALAHLNGHIVHYSFGSVSDFLDRMAKYAVNTAADRFKRGKKVSWFGTMVHTWWAFMKGYVLRLGFLDGGAGLLIAFSSCAGVFYRYAILKEMNDESRDAEQ